MKRRTKIIATVGPQRTVGTLTPFDEADFCEGDMIPHGTLLRSYIDAGADIIRLNMSFASKSESYGENEASYLQWLEDNRDHYAKRVAVLADLPGPKIRLGKVFIGKDSELRKGGKFHLGFGRANVEEPGAMVLVNEEPFNEAVTGVNGSKNIVEYLKSRVDPVLLSIGDGVVELQAVDTKGEDIVSCEVISERLRLADITEGKGLTIKRATLEVDAFQNADRRAVDFLLEHGGEVLAFIGVSFAQTRRDILQVKNYMETHPLMKEYANSQPATERKGTVRLLSPGIIAKIETRKAWGNIDEILDVADGAMVARGDLGEQLPPEAVPEIQKELIRKCNVRGKPVITATQMLESMISNPGPTRAEAADVFNAILDGSDAVMLSGETSMGNYPIQAIHKMGEIAEKAEEYYFMPAHRREFRDVLKESRDQVKANTTRLETEQERAKDVAETVLPRQREYPLWISNIYEEKAERSSKQATTDRICEAACGLSEAGRFERKGMGGESEVKSSVGDYKAILVPTTSGRTAFMISRFRPRVPIIGVAHYRRTYRKLIIGFGVIPVLIGSDQRGVSAVLGDACKEARSLDLLAADDEVVATLGSPLYKPGTTNLVQILKVGQA